MSSGREPFGEMPHLGYMSIGQLQEHAMDTHPSHSEEFKANFGTRVFNTLVRSGLVDTLPGHTLPADAERPGYPLVDMDSLQRHQESGILSALVGMGEASERLLAGYMEGRIHFLDGQQIEPVIS